MPFHIVLIFLSIDGNSAKRSNIYNEISFIYILKFHFFDECENSSKLECKSAVKMHLFYFETRLASRLCFQRTQLPRQALDTFEWRLNSDGTVKPVRAQLEWKRSLDQSHANHPHRGNTRKPSKSECADVAAEEHTLWRDTDKNLSLSLSLFPPLVRSRETVPLSVEAISRL